MIRVGRLVGAAAAAAGIGWGLDRLRRATEQARIDAVRAAATATRLQRAAEALSVAVTPEQVLEALLTEGVAAAEARAGLIARVSDDGTTLEVLAERGYRPGLMEAWQTFPIDAEFPLSYAVRTGEPVFLRSQAERMKRFPALGSTGEPTHALVCLPLTVEQRAIGGLVFSFGEDQEFDEERRAMKVALARQAAQALERARLYEVLRNAEARVSFLARASELLSSALDYETTIGRLAAISVPQLADWCTVDMLDSSGSINRLAVAHVDPGKVEWGWEIHRRFPPEPNEDAGMIRVLRTGEPEFLPEVPKELLDRAASRRPGLREVIDELGLRSWICVPLKARDAVVGALSLVMSDSARLFTQADFELAVAVADRAGVAIENALLYREAERRGDAARALTYVGDAVVLVDRDRLVRYWNRAAETLTGTREAEALGRPAADSLRGWTMIVENIRPVDATSGEIASATTIPVTIDGEERWFSAAAVDFGEGRVFTLRDVTREHAVEQARSDFVATASHELRTPLAAVYGAVRTLRRPDADLDDAETGEFLQMIESETERLKAIVDQILLAGELDGGTVRVNERSCDVAQVARDVIAAAALRKPESIELTLGAPEDLPPARCDESRLRQVLVNLVENAIKYSPDGGPVTVELTSADAKVEVAVHDRGLGISQADQERIFQKFVRLDPGLTRGVGGTGLGLYIARELVERMEGELAVVSSPGRGSTFTVRLPAAVPAGAPVSSTPAA